MCAPVEIFAKWQVLHPVLNNRWGIFLYADGLSSRLVVGVGVGVGVEGREMNAVNNASSDEERAADSQLVILNSKGGAYKLRDSRYSYLY